MLNGTEMDSPVVAGAEVMDTGEVAKQRLIKKYPNRRLYDTEQSRYITLAEVRELVCGDVAFVIVDARSGENITRAVLLQVVLEQEAGADALFSMEMMTKLIRFHGDGLRTLLAQCLQQQNKAAA